jgi:signal transduction histidine kinase/CheY-like chemotaxis protein/HPt (histidine-containing phosphotransfer) domain-containing protein
MMLITRLGGVVAGLLVLYYVELTLNMPDAARSHFRWTGTAALAATGLLTLLIALRETRCLRRTLRSLRTGATLPPGDALTAGREAVLFAGRHHRMEACLAPVTCILPVLIVLRVVDAAGWEFLATVGLASLMAIAMFLISTFLVVEHSMKPVVRELLKSGVAINYASLPVGRLKFRFALCFTSIILTTALMIGILARQRALDIITNPADQTAAVHSLVLHSTYITFVAVVVGLVYSVLLTNSVGSRLHALLSAMEEVGRGDLSARLGPTGNDEVDILTRQFNDMVVELDQDHRTIRELNCTLEEKVRLRTAQLEATVSRLKETQQQLTDYNRQLETARERAEDANRAKGQFLANVSHELRTPLSGVLGMIELLMETPLDDQQRRFAATVRNSASSLLRLLNDVLDFSKVEAGKLDIETIEFNLRETVEPVVEAASYRCVEKPLEIAFYLDPTIPETLCGDPGRIRQVLANLVNNAVKFTERGSVVVRVERTEGKVGAGSRIRENSEVDRPADRILTNSPTLSCSVRDTGIGIPPDRYDRLFQSFSQVDAATTRKFGGSGLGLAICRQLCTLMGGDVDFESRVGAGSTFTFRLPLLIPKTKPDRPCTDTFTENWSQQWVHANVLVIDDNGPTRETLAEQLSSWGFQVEQAADLPEALQCLHDAEQAEDGFQLVFVDSMLDGLQPRDFAERVHAEPVHRDCRLLMMVPLGRAVKCSGVLADGFSHCLTKPVLLSTLFEAVANVTAAGEPADAAKTDDLRRPKSGRKRDSRTKSRFCGARILLAEDDEINRDVAGDVLRHAGFDVLIVEDGTAAVQTVASQPVDLVLMDCQMPGMDGFAATKSIRERERAATAPYSGTLPIVALTANAQSGERENCLAAGMNDYLSKPVRPKELIAVIETALAKSNVRHPVLSADPISRRAPAPGSIEVSSKPDASACRLTSTFPQVLDYGALLARCMDDEALARRLLQKFDARIDDSLAEIAREHRRGNARRVRALAHGLKGSAANIAADAVSRLASDLESLSRADGLDDAEDCLAELHREIQRLRCDISVVMASATAPESMVLANEGEPCAS